MTNKFLRGAAFIDRDGTINVEVNYLHEPERTVILPGAAEALDLIHAHDYLAVVVTNQAGIAKGMYGEAEMRAVHDRIRELLAPATFDALYYCPHHPEFTGKCSCRKPLPGMLLQAARELDIDLARSFMVGDRASDIGAGLAAGCSCNYLVRTGYGETALQEAGGAISGAKVADDLLAAVRDFFGA